MGGNPLPNWVAAVSLLRPGGKVFLLHSTFSDNASQTLQAVLVNSPIAPVSVSSIPNTSKVSTNTPANLPELPAIAAVERISLENEHDNPERIRHAIRTLVQREPDLRWGLNYTGGTKPMSVHSYQTLVELQANAIFSYLDATTGQLSIERSDTSPTRLRVTPPLSLDTIFQLHGYTWQTHQPPRRNALQAEAACQLAKALQNRPISQQWRTWCHKILHPATKDSYNHYWKDIDQINLDRPLPLLIAPPAIRQILQEHFGATHGLELSRFAEWGFTDPIELCAWLDGVWLEHVVLATLQRRSPELSLCDVGLGFHIADPNNSRGWDKFEFDVATTRGYQLFGLSCTTATTKKLCKQKLIEAAQRATQLGGSEARFALVCGYEYPHILLNELETLTRNPKIAVFGRADWLQLDRRITDWITSSELARSPRPTLTPPPR
jgi:hypothetical protein